MGNWRSGHALIPTLLRLLLLRTGVKGGVLLLGIGGNSMHRTHTKTHTAGSHRHGVALSSAGQI